MVLRRVIWVHNYKIRLNGLIRSNGLERRQLVHNDKIRSNGLERVNWVHSTKIKL